MDEKRENPVKTTPLNHGNRYEWHILPRGDRLIEANGSAVLRVCRELAKASVLAGNRSDLIGDSNLEHDNQDFSCKIDYSRLKDSKAGSAIGMLLNFVCIRGYRDGFRITADETCEVPGRIFVHNRPWAGHQVRRQFPNSELVLYLHNTTMAGTPGYVMRAMLAEFDAVVCVSDYLRAELIGRSKVRLPDQRKIISIRNSVDAPLFDQGSTPLYDLLYVGRIIPEKGLHVLLQAIADKRLAKVTVMVVGGSSFLSNSPSAYEIACRSYADRHGLCVQFIGPKPPAAVPGLMSSCRIVVIPSSWDDPCPLVVQEAMASAAAVLATRSGGIPELGGSNEGLNIVEKNAPSEMRDAIIELLRCDDVWREAGAAGQIAVRRRTWVDAYKELAEKISVACARVTSGHCETVET